VPRRLWPDLVAELSLAALGLGGALLLGVSALGFAGLLGLVYATLMLALARLGLRAAAPADLLPALLPALALAEAGMLLLLLCGLGAAAWSLLAEVATVPAASGAAPAVVVVLSGEVLRLAGLLALAGAALATAMAARHAASRDAAPVRLVGPWRTQALVWLAVACALVGGWWLRRLEAAAGVAAVGALLGPALVLLPAALHAWWRWPGPVLRTAPPRRLRAATERVLADVLAELPVAGRQLTLRRHAGCPYLHLVVVVDDDLDLDAESQDVLRARLYERLRGAFPDLVLDVVFTRDPVWAARGLGGAVA
jgi:hypothetical protein